MAYIVMAYIVMADLVKAYIVMASYCLGRASSSRRIVMAYIVMDYFVMAYLVKADAVMAAYCLGRARRGRRVRRVLEEVWVSSEHEIEAAAYVVVRAEAPHRIGDLRYLRIWPIYLRSYGLCSYVLYRYGLYSNGLYSHGLYSYGGRKRSRLPSSLQMLARKTSVALVICGTCGNGRARALRDMFRRVFRHAFRCVFRHVHPGGV